MGKNTGKKSENSFEAQLTKLGKRAYFHRLTDAADVKGRTGVVGYQPKQPSDYMIVLDGQTSFAEVKSTQNQTSFPFSLLKPGQTAHAKRILAAGGNYLVFVHNLTTDVWYRIPMSVIEAVKARGNQSIPWSDLSEFVWVCGM